MEKSYKFEFLVKAENWEEVVQIFKDQLGIDKNKQDSSVRDMNGLFLVQVKLAENQINKDFYSAVRSSDVLAITDSPLCAKERYEILEETYRVETKLRKLLIHISDVAEEYYDFFLKSPYTKTFAKKNSLIPSDDLDPVTSHLTFGDMLNILSINLSWKSRTLTTEDLLHLLNDQLEIRDVRNKLKTKMKDNLVWDIVCKYVLKRQVPWGEIREDFQRLKRLRDKAAHFQIVTEKDTIEARVLTKRIMNKLDQKDISLSDFMKLREATYPLADLLSSFNQASGVVNSFQKSMSEPSRSLRDMLAASIADYQEALNTVGLKTLKTRLDTPNPSPESERQE